MTTKQAAMERERTERYITYEEALEQIANSRPSSHDKSAVIPALCYGSRLKRIAQKALKKE